MQVVGIENIQEDEMQNPNINIEEDDMLDPNRNKQMTRKLSIFYQIVDFSSKS